MHSYKFPLSCHSGRQHENKHKKYVFAKFLYSITDLLVQHSLNQTMVEKYLPCGFSFCLFFPPSLLCLSILQLKGSKEKYH